MIAPTTLRRSVVAATGAAALALGTTVAVASGPDTANPRGGAAADAPAVSALFPPGSELQFVSVAPCRIVDTRNAGGPISAGSRTFDTTLGTYAGQGGKAGTCNLPSTGVVSVQLNLGAISQNGKTSHFTGWATGTPEPTASLINYNPSGPIANMVTLPVSAGGLFTLKTPGDAHAFIDVAGYYVKPLYVAVAPGGGIYDSTASGVVSTARTGVGHYTVTFNRDVERCAAAGTAIQWVGNQEVSVDTNVHANPNTVEYEIRNQTNTAIDSWAYIALTC